MIGKSEEEINAQKELKKQEKIKKKEERRKEIQEAAKRRNHQAEAAEPVGLICY